MGAKAQKGLKGHRESQARRGTRGLKGLKALLVYHRRSGSGTERLGGGGTCPGGICYWSYIIPTTVPFATTSDAVMVSLAGFDFYHVTGDWDSIEDIDLEIEDWTVTGGNTITVYGHVDVSDIWNNDPYDYSIRFSVIAFDELFFAVTSQRGPSTEEKHQAK